MNAHVTGVVDPRYVGRCTYRVGGRGCLVPATWHGVDSEYKYGIMTCDEHQPLMMPLVYWVHEMEPACGLPGSRFCVPENRCEVDWDTLETEFTSYAAEETP